MGERERGRVRERDMGGRVSPPLGRLAGAENQTFLSQLEGQLESLLHEPTACITSLKGDLELTSQVSRRGDFGGTGQLLGVYNTLWE